MSKLIVDYRSTQLHCTVHCETTTSSIGVYACHESCGKINFSFQQAATVRLLYGYVIASGVFASYTYDTCNTCKLNVVLKH